MAFTEQIRLVIDVATGNTRSTLGRLSSDLKQADGAFAKVKVGAGAVGDFLKTNMAFAAGAAGTAIVDFGIKSVQAFTEAGRAAGLLRDQTKLTAEEASRLAEVGADIGIPVEALATAIGRMNRAAATTPGAFSGIGASLKTAADGSLDVNATFLETIDAINRIPDAAERADAAQRIFGRGWQQIAEFITMGADNARDVLEGVSDAQVFSDEEIAKAREMHARLEDLQDRFLAIQLAVGEFVVDFVDGLGVINNAIGETITQAKRLATFQDLRVQLFGSEEVSGVTNFAAGLKEANDAIREAKENASAAQGPVAKTADELEAMAEAYRQAGVDANVVNGKLVVTKFALAEQAEAADAARRAHEGLQDAFRDAARAADEQRQAMADLRLEALNAAGRVLDLESNQLALADAMDDVTDRQKDAADAVGEFGDHSDEAKRASNDLRQAQISAAEQALATAQAFADQSGAAEGSRKHTNLMRDALTMMAGENPAIRAEIQAMIDKLDAIPAKKKPELGVEGAEEAGRKADDVHHKVDDIPDSHNTVVTAEDRATAILDIIRNALDQLHDKTVTVTTVSRGSTSNPIFGGSTSALGAGSTDSFMAATVARNAGGRVRDLFNEAQALVSQAHAHRDLAKSLREQAAAEKDEDEKKKLVDKADKEAAQAADLLEKARDKATRAADVHAEATDREEAALRREVDTLRRHADALNAQADAYRERAASNVEAVDAFLALQDAQVQAAEAFGTLRRAMTTEGVTRAQQAAARNDAQQAALSVAEAAVNRAREQAERSGRRFTEADAARARLESLRQQAEQGGPVGRAIREVIQRIDFPNLFRELREANQRDERARETRGDARELERAANQLGRMADVFPDVTANLVRALAAGRISDAEFDRRVRQVLNRIAHAARAGRR